jgi:hypothetical protein
MKDWGLCWIAGIVEDTVMSTEKAREAAAMRYIAYPGSERLGLGDKRPIAYFEYKDHAERYVQMFWPEYGYVEEADTV